MTKKKIFKIIALSALALFIIATTIYLSFSYTWEEIMEFINPIITTAEGWLTIFGGSTLVVIISVALKIVKMGINQKTARTNFNFLRDKTDTIIENVNSQMSIPDTTAFMNSTYQFCKYMAEREPSKAKKKTLQEIVNAMKSEIADAEKLKKDIIKKQIKTIKQKEVDK